MKWSLPKRTTIGSLLNEVLTHDAVRHNEFVVNSLRTVLICGQAISMVVFRGDWDTLFWRTVRYIPGGWIGEYRCRSCSQTWFVSDESAAWFFGGENPGCDCGGENFEVNPSYW